MKTMVKKSKIEDRQVFAISDFSDMALVERTRRAARSGKGTLLSLSGPQSDSDVSISRSGSGSIELDISNFNSQRRHLEEGSPIQEWEGGPFHLGSEIVLAAWLCGEMDADSLVFVGKLSDSGPLVAHAVSRIIEEYGLPVKFTHSSGLVRRLGEADIQPNLKEEENKMYPYRVEKVEEVFDNRIADPLLSEASSVEVIEDRRKSSEDMDVTVRWGEGQYGKDSDFRFIQSVSTDLIEIPRTRVVLLGTDVRECVSTCEGYHSIYLPSDEARKKLLEIRISELPDVERLGLSTRAVLMVSMASSYEEFRTHGVLDSVGRRERQFLKRLEFIQHD